MNKKVFEPIEFYREQEKQFNKSLLSRANCPDFIYTVRTILDIHLNQVVEYRKLVQTWLDLLDIPSKDDITGLSKTMIRLEGRVDSLEDHLFMMTSRSKRVPVALNSYYNDLLTIRNLLDNNLPTVKTKSKIELLKDEFEDLKSTI
jgi:hypothetical protein